jgi:hypothetical protein
MKETWSTHRVVKPHSYLPPHSRAANVAINEEGGGDELCRKTECSLCHFLAMWFWIFSLCTLGPLNCKVEMVKNKEEYKISLNAIYHVKKIEHMAVIVWNLHIIYIMSYIFIWCS